MRTLPRIGVSSCLLGERVRYDGAQKRVPWILQKLARVVELIPTCPEVGAGMSVPRPPIQLVEHGPGDVRLQLSTCSPKGGSFEGGAALIKFCQARLDTLEALGLHGYLFKARSPSCGLSDTPVFSETMEIMRRGPGLWAQYIVARWPEMPVADESISTDEIAREDFVARVSAYRDAARSRRLFILKPQV